MGVPVGDLDISVADFAHPHIAVHAGIAHQRNRRVPRLMKLDEGDARGLG